MAPRLEAVFHWSNGPLPARGRVETGRVDDLDPVTPEAFSSALDRVLVGAERLEESCGAFRGPTWSWTAPDESLVLSSFLAVDGEDGEIWGELEVTADCRLDTFLDIWRKLLQEGPAVWALVGEEIVGIDAFREAAAGEGWLRDEWPGGVDVLGAEALADVDLPPATKKWLRSGVPREVLLPGWEGPTLFSSELGAGRFPAAEVFAEALARHGFGHALSIGTVRMNEEPPIAGAVFCLQPRTGELWLVDIGEPHMARFVNSGLDQFLQSVRMFLGAWGVGSPEDDDFSDRAHALQRSLKDIDAEAFADEDSYWPTWLETEFELP